MRLTIGIKFGGVMLLALLLVLLAGLAGVYEVRQLGAATDRLASAAETSQLGQTIRLQLVDLERELRAGVERQDGPTLLASAEAQLQAGRCQHAGARGATSGPGPRQQRRP